MIRPLLLDAQILGLRKESGMSRDKEDKAAAAQAESPSARSTKRSTNAGGGGGRAAPEGAWHGRIWT